MTTRYQDGYAQRQATHKDRLEAHVACMDAKQRAWDAARFGPQQRQQPALKIDHEALSKLPKVIHAKADWDAFCAAHGTSATADDTPVDF